jgi:hypothetical protein
MGDIYKEAEEFTRNAKIKSETRPRVKKFLSLVSYEEDAKIMVDFLRHKKADQWRNILYHIPIIGMFLPSSIWYSHDRRSFVLWHLFTSIVFYVGGFTLWLTKLTA